MFTVGQGFNHIEQSDHRPKQAASDLLERAVVVNPACATLMSDSDIFQNGGEAV